MSSLNDPQAPDRALSFSTSIILSFLSLITSTAPALLRRQPSIDLNALLLPVLVFLDLSLERSPFLDEAVLLDFVELGDLSELLGEDVEERLRVWAGVARVGRKKRGGFEVGVAADGGRGRSGLGNGFLEGFVAGRRGSQGIRLVSD
jgi:hypothetical protein